MDLFHLPFSTVACPNLLLGVKDGGRGSVQGRELPLPATSSRDWGEQHRQAKSYHWFLGWFPCTVAMPSQISQARQISQADSSPAQVGMCGSLGHRHKDAPAFQLKTQCKWISCNTLTLPVVSKLAIDQKGTLVDWTADLLIKSCRE